MQTVPAIQEDDGKCGPWGGRQTVLGSGKSKKVPEQEDCTGVAQRAKARLQNERADFLPQSPLPPSPGEASGNPWMDGGSNWFSGGRVLGQNDVI